MSREKNVCIGKKRCDSLSGCRVAAVSTYFVVPQDKTTPYVSLVISGLHGVRSDSPHPFLDLRVLQQSVGRGAAARRAVGSVGKHACELASAKGARHFRLLPGWPCGAPVSRPQRAGERLCRDEEEPDTSQVRLRMYPAPIVLFVLCTIILPCCTLKAIASNVGPLFVCAAEQLAFAGTQEGPRKRGGT